MKVWELGASLLAELLKLSIAAPFLFSRCQQEIIIGT
jgi:hypothetical protein